MSDPATYIITVRAEGDGPPAIIRLRRAFKILLRACGVRILSAVEDTHSKPHSASAKASAKSEARDVAGPQEASHGGGCITSSGPVRTNVQARRPPA